MTSPTPPESGHGLSVIIPVLDEADYLGPTLDAVIQGAWCGSPDVIVVDGGSSDGTCDIARSKGARVICCDPCRATQMNRGAASATGDALLFLHADTLVPLGYDKHIHHILTDRGIAGGAFRLSIDAPGAAYRLIEQGVNWRSRWLSLPYGDQGLFLRCGTFRQLGGYAGLCVMEDYELVRRLGRLGRIQLAPARVMTSVRRWLKQGFFCATLTNQACIIGYHLGIQPERLAGWRDKRCPRRDDQDRRDPHAASDHGSGRIDRQRPADTAGS